MWNTPALRISIPGRKANYARASPGKTFETITKATRDQRLRVGVNPCCSHCVNQQEPPQQPCPTNGTNVRRRGTGVATPCTNIRKANSGFVGVTQQAVMDDRDVLPLVLAHLPRRQVGLAACVCRTWRDAAAHVPLCSPCVLVACARTAQLVDVTDLLWPPPPHHDALLLQRHAAPPTSTATQPSRLVTRTRRLAPAMTLDQVSAAEAPPVQEHLRGIRLRVTKAQQQANPQPLPLGPTWLTSIAISPYGRREVHGCGDAEALHQQDFGQASTCWPSACLLAWQATLCLQRSFSQMGAPAFNPLLWWQAGLYRVFQRPSIANGFCPFRCTCQCRCQYQCSGVVACRWQSMAKAQKRGGAVPPLQAPGPLMRAPHPAAASRPRMRVVLSHETLAAPEGVAFAFGHMYVQVSNKRLSM
jgi:hypothetical protein